MNIFYSKVCVKTTTDQSGKEICQTLSNAEAVNNHLSSRTSLRDTGMVIIFHGLVQTLSQIL